MDGYIIVAIRYERRFIWNKNQKREHCDGKNKVMPISKAIKFGELADMMYEVTWIDCNTPIKIKFIFQSYYKLDPIDIKNDNNIYCFIMQQLSSEKR